MRRLTVLLPFIFIMASCSKKTSPSKSAKVIYNAETPVTTTTTTSTTTSADIKKREKKKRAAEFPKTIYVNDAAAKKSVDGRLYYDVKGHRYWKNYKDGQYYLFNKSMYSNPDFKPPVQ